MRRHSYDTPYRLLGRCVKCDPHLVRDNGEDQRDTLAGTPRVQFEGLGAPWLVPTQKTRHAGNQADRDRLAVFAGGSVADLETAEVDGRIKLQCLPIGNCVTFSSV